MRAVLAIIAGYLAGVAATVGLALLVSAVLAGGRLLSHFDAAVPRALGEMGAAVALVAAPGWIMARGMMGVVGLHSPWAFAMAGAVAALLGLALLPGMPFSFGIMGMGAVAGVVAGLVERGLSS
jgi:hypothetical protein